MHGWLEINDDRGAGLEQVKVTFETEQLKGETLSIQRRR